MPYLASNGTLSNKPYSPTTGIPTDGRSYFYDGTNFLWRPYASEAEVITELNSSIKRTGHFPIYINIGGTLGGDGHFTGGVVTEWWFKDGVADENLVLKETPETSFTFTDGNGFDGSVVGNDLSLTTTVGNTQIPYSASGALAGTGNFTWNNTNSHLAVIGSMAANKTVTNNTTGISASSFVASQTMTAVVSQTTGSVYGSGLNIFTINNNVNNAINISTIQSTNTNILRIGSSGASTLTVNQGTSDTRRAISANCVLVQLDNTSVISTVDHLAGLQVLAVQATNGSGVSSANLMNITNYYGLLLGNTAEYSNSAAKITNSYAIYQAGPTDINQFYGPVKSDNDIEVLQTLKGVILKAPNGLRWRITVDNSGTLITTIA